MIRIYLACLLVFGTASIVSAECMSWLLCPYLLDEPNSRYVSLNDTSLRNWQEIEVKGNRALVCMMEEWTARDIALAGCSEVRRAEIPSLLIPPHVPFFNGIEVEFMDGKEGRPNRQRAFNPGSIRHRIQDSAITQDVLEGARR